MMKSKLNCLIGAAALLALPMLAQASISGSSHDFTASGVSPVAGVTEICKPCHVPHRPKQNVPLWATNLTVGTYNLYDENATYSGTTTWYDASPVAFTGSKSRACLSCHDGTQAVAGGYTLSTTDPSWILWDNGAAVAGGVNSNGLKGSHPIAVDYSAVAAAKPTEYVAVASLDTAVRLEASKVQCTSCHNPHNKVPGTKMLVLSNASSALCLKCHVK